MKLYQALLVAYLAAVAFQIAAGQNNNGDGNGNYNLGEFAALLWCLHEASAPAWSGRAGSHCRNG
jgi:hypothetical protein